MYTRSLQRLLHKESEEITSQFFDLSRNTLKLLATEGTSVETLKEYVSLLLLFSGKSTPTLGDIVEPAKTVYEVIFILAKQHFITFYNFKILESIIEKLCNDKDGKLKTQLAEYKVQFKVYIKRRVCETCLYYGGEFNPEVACTLEEGCNLVLITDENWDHDISLKAVLDLECNVADIFGIKKFVLRLEAIESKCLQLYYSIPPDVIQVILPIKQEQALKLMRCGIAEIHCGSYHIALQTCKCWFPNLA